MVHCFWICLKTPLCFPYLGCQLNLAELSTHLSSEQISPSFPYQIRNGSSPFRFSPLKWRKAIWLKYSSSFYYRMKIWQRPIGGHVQATFVISISGIFTKILHTSNFQSFPLSAHDPLWVAVRSSYDSRTIVYNEELYFNQIERKVIYTCNCI